MAVGRWAADVAEVEHEGALAEQVEREVLPKAMGDAVGEVGVERVSRVREGEVGAGLDGAEGGTAGWAMPAPTSLAM